MKRFSHSVAKMFSLSLLSASFIASAHAYPLKKVHRRDFKLTPDLASLSFQATKIESLPFTTPIAGKFNRINGLFSITDDLRNSRIELTITASSIDLGSEIQNTVAKSSALLNVKKYPSIYIESRRLAPNAESFTVTAKIRVHGRNAVVTFPLNCVSSHEFAADFLVNVHSLIEKPLVEGQPIPTDYAAIHLRLKTN